MIDVWEQCYGCDGKGKETCYCCDARKRCTVCDGSRFVLVDGRAHKKRWFRVRAERVVREHFPRTILPASGRVMRDEFILSMAKDLLGKREPTLLIIGPGWCKMPLAEAVEHAKRQNKPDRRSQAWECA